MAQSRILIIEDESPIRETMQLTLDVAGYQAETAADGPEGLRKFGDGAGWDLVLLDQRMPGMEGVDVLRRLHQINPAVPVILVTAYGSIGLTQQTLGSGARGFLRKPITPGELRKVVQDVLAAPARAAGKEGGQA